MVLSRGWGIVGLGVALFALRALVWAVMALLRVVRQSVLLRVPFQNEQTITFNETGEFSLNAEGDSLRSLPSGARYELYPVGGSAPVPLSPVLFRAEVSSFSRSRLELFRFGIEKTGTYLLRIDGMERATESEDFAVVITRSSTASMVSHIVVVILFGALLIGSLVLAGLVIAGTPLTPKS